MSIERHRLAVSITAGSDRCAWRLTIWFKRGRKLSETMSSVPSAVRYTPFESDGSPLAIGTSLTAASAAIDCDLQTARSRGHSN